MEFYGCPKYFYEVNLNKVGFILQKQMRVFNVDEVKVGYFTGIQTKNIFSDERLNMFNQSVQTKN